MCRAGASPAVCFRNRNGCPRMAFCYKAGMKMFRASILSLSILISRSACGQQTPQSLADAELPSVLTIYKDIHTDPDLSWHEERTSAFTAKALRAAGCQ